jgi:hypothetical protein
MDDGTAGSPLCRVAQVRATADANMLVRFIEDVILVRIFAAKSRRSRAACRLQIK